MTPPLDQTRYTRQIILPEIGILGQKRLAQASVCVVGAGGLGAPCLLYLAAAGVGHLTVIDPDTVAIDNLQRQILYETAQTARTKTDCAAERLRALNPDITIQTISDALLTHNALSYLQHADIIVDASDNFATRFLINDAAIILGKPVVYGAIQGFIGQVSVFWAKAGPCYRCLFPQPPSYPVQNCAEAGVLGAFTGIIGSAQALETIKLIVEHPTLTPLIGTLWVLDGSTLNSQRLHIPKASHHCICSHDPKQIILPSTPPPACNQATIPTITPAQLSTLPTRLIDVRETPEWAAGHIPEALHHPLSQLTQRPGTIPPTTERTVLYCQSGPRSQKAARILQTQGVLNLHVLQGGYIAWQETRNL